MSTAHLAQAPQGAADRLVVDELSVASGEDHEQGAVAAHPRDVVQKLGGGGVEPLHVVDRQHDRGRTAGALPDELQHRCEQPVAALRAGVVARELGEEGAEIRTEAGPERARGKLPEGVDPGPEGPPAFRLEGPPLEDGAAPLPRPLPGLVEEPRLAEPGRPVTSSTCSRLSRTVSSRAFSSRARSDVRPTSDSRRVGGGTTASRDGEAATASSRPIRHACSSASETRPAQLLAEATGRLVLLLGLAPAAGGREHPDEAGRAPSRPGGRRRRASARGAVPLRGRRPVDRRGCAGGSRGACAPPRARPRTRPGSRGSRRGRAPRGAPRGTRCASATSSPSGAPSSPAAQRSFSARMSIQAPCASKATLSRGARIRGRSGSSTSARIRLRLHRRAPRGSSATSQRRLHRRSRRWGRPLRARYASSPRVFLEGGRSRRWPPRTISISPRKRSSSAACPDTFPPGNPRTTGALPPPSA